MQVRKFALACCFGILLRVSYRQKNSRIKRVWIALASHIGFSTVHLTFLSEKQVGMEFPTLNAARIVAEKQVCRNIFARSLFCYLPFAKKNF